eukprot:CAMPEP_0197428878 /NCGR_PEP_ID=MMETSP1170-20131217/42349_1 /TAXON_ID=54406 /ORGANISM="Sarcinochrysis sp, Strain CCMP770" /LENGTH=65 /DNA_ID=CAMNT_0042956669 /DNA_START=226 /DNA_END=423 /DNA_ORIENTATION=-
MPSEAAAGLQSEHARTGVLLRKWLKTLEFTSAAEFAVSLLISQRKLAPDIDGIRCSAKLHFVYGA